jgi:hypothetical protein
MMALVRRAYIGAMRGLRGTLRPLGLLERLEALPGRRARWVRSLFAIYDFDDLAALDLPWWTFDAVDEVEAFLAVRPGARVFEWGAGASTLWLAWRAGEVISVEHDPDWAANVAARTEALDHVAVRLAPSSAQGAIGSGKSGFAGRYFDAYVAAIRAEPGLFDLIIIDGRAREACLAEAQARLAEGGVVLFDDCDRARYRGAIEASGLEMRRLGGLAVCLPLPDATALLTCRAA